MKIQYPDNLDAFNLGRSRAEKNAASKGILFEKEDVPFLLQELQIKMGSSGSDDPASLDYRVAAVETFLTTMLSAGIDTATSLKALIVTGILRVGDIEIIGKIKKYDNAIPVSGRMLLGDGTAFVETYPTFAQNSVLQPVGICPPINASSTLTLTSNSSWFVHVGRIVSEITTLDMMFNVTTAITSAIWAEVGVFKGVVNYNGNASLSRVGFTDVSTVINSTGIKKVTVALSGITAGDDLWLAIGNQNSGTTPIVRSTVADELGQGVFQTLVGRISTAAIPVMTTIGGTGTAIPWITAKW